MSIVGRIDLVRRIDTGETTIVDLKSSDRAQPEDVTETQLHVYALGYQDLTGRRPDYVEIYELDERKRKPRSVDDDFIADVKTKVRRCRGAAHRRAAHRACRQEVRDLRLSRHVHGRPCRRCNQVTRSKSDMAREPKKPKTEKKGHPLHLRRDQGAAHARDRAHVALAGRRAGGDAADGQRLEQGDRGRQAAGGDERPVVVDMDPAADPVLFWAGKRNRREVPVLPLQRNEIVSESRIAQIIERARRAAEEKSGAARQGHLFADLEKTLRESDRAKRVEFYTHEEGWKNKLICGDSLHVMESLLHYENLRGKVQMIYIDPPYGIKYDSNFQQRVDSTKNDEKDQADDVLTIKAFRDTWALGVHSYLSYLQERLYLCRELLADSGSVFVQISDDNAHQIVELADGTIRSIVTASRSETIPRHYPPGRRFLPLAIHSSQTVKPRARSAPFDFDGRTS